MPQYNLNLFFFFLKFPVFVFRDWRLSQVKLSFNISWWMWQIYFINWYLPLFRSKIWIKKFTVYQKLVKDNDGWVSDSKSGACVFRWNSNFEYSFILGSYVTIFKTEIFAIMRRSLIETSGPSIIFFCSDSAAALKAIVCTRTNSNVVCECKLKLHKLTQSY